MRKIYFLIVSTLILLSVTPSNSFAVTQTGVEITSSYGDATTTSVKMILDYSYETATAVSIQGFKVIYNKDQSIDGSKEASKVIWTGILPLGEKGTKEGIITGLTAETTYDYDVIDVNPSVTEVYAYGQFITIADTGGDTPIVLTGDDAVGAFTNTKCDEGKGDYCLLAPLPDPTAEGGIRYKTNTACLDETDPDCFRLGNYINLMLKVIIGIAGVLAVVMIVIGGIQYMSTDAFSGKEEGKSRITNALLGLVLLAGSFMILNTINPNLVNFHLKIDSVNLTVTDADISTPPKLMGDGTYDVPTEQQTGNGTLFKDGEPFPNDYNTGTLAALRDDITGKLLPVGSMGVSSTTGEACLTVGQSGCTSVYFDLSTATALYSKIQQLRTACSCNFTISGGSEYWLHKTHGLNKQIIDISLSKTSESDITKLNNYLTQGESTTFPIKSPCYKKSLPAPFTTGFSFAENANCSAPNHWHINFQDAN